MTFPAGIITGEAFLRRDTRQKTSSQAGKVMATVVLCSLIDKSALSSLEWLQNERAAVYSYNLLAIHFFAS